MFDTFTKKCTRNYTAAYTKNFNAMPQIIKRTEQCKVDMQIAWLKLKLFDSAADSGCLHVNVEENGEFNCHKLLILFYFIS